MPKAHARVSESTLKTPKAAAIAGILFAGLQLTSLILIRSHVPVDPVDSGQWLASSTRVLRFALTLTPFAGIAFLWYMGVMRDRLGHQEDQFFATLFLGSGILYLAMTFIATAMAAGAVTAYRLNANALLDGEAYLLVRAMIYEINNVYAVRMSGMHMLVLSTIWLRTDLMSRWITIFTIVLAFALLLTINFILWISLVFPAWVGLVSIYILVQNYRHKQDDDLDDESLQEPSLQEQSLPAVE